VGRLPKYRAEGEITTGLTSLTRPRVLDPAKPTLGDVDGVNGVEHSRDDFVIVDRALDRESAVERGREGMPRATWLREKVDDTLGLRRSRDTLGLRRSRDTLGLRRSRGPGTDSLGRYGMGKMIVVGRLMIGANLILGCSAGVETTGEAGGEGSEELFGCVSESRIAPFVQATVRVNTTTSMCSGTLVAPNQVLTAAHCLCKSQTGTVTFAGNDGNVAATARKWPIIGHVTAPNAKVCADDWADLGEGDPAFHMPWDIALLTIGPDAVGLPPITPMPMYLADTGRAVSNGTLHLNAWAAGYGNNAPAPWVGPTGQCAGCSVRRSGPIGEVIYGADSCSYVGPVPLEEDCYNSPLFYAKSISKGNWTEASTGDSGSGLFFNIDLACTNSNEGTTQTGLVGGVYSAWHDATDTRSRWAPLGHSGKFICDNLNVPFARTVAQGRSDAIYALGNVSLNDRSRVLAEPTGAIGTTVSAGGTVNVGTDALVGAVSANGTVDLRERAVVQNTVRATGSIIPQNGVSTGTRSEGLCSKVEPFSLTVPFSAGTSDWTVENIRGPALADYPIAPSRSVKDLTVRAGVRLIFQPGLYVFRNLDVESGAVLKIPANTWIFVLGAGEQRVRGDIDADARLLFWGMPNATSVALGGEWRGALVAPKAHVVGDMRTGAMLSGNFFVNHFTLHQGRWLFGVPFAGSWVPTCSLDRTSCL
jgi:hypothetical protein